MNARVARAGSRRRRFWIRVVGSLAVHAALGWPLAQIARRERTAPVQPVIELIDVSVAPSPPPLPPPPPPPPPIPVAAPAPAPRSPPAGPRLSARAPRAPRTAAPPPTPTAPASADTAPPDPAAEPVFSASLSSSQAGGAARGGPAGLPGGTGAPGGGAGGGAGGGGRVLSAAEATRLPLPRGRCTGAYTDQARAAGIEGVVVLDLIVEADGRTRDIAVVEALSHGLTEAAVRALAACRFVPGERDGRPVAVKVRQFKIRFWLDDAE